GGAGSSGRPDTDQGRVPATLLRAWLFRMGDRRLRTCLSLAFDSASLEPQARLRPAQPADCFAGLPPLASLSRPGGLGSELRRTTFPMGLRLRDRLSAEGAPGRTVRHRRGPAGNLSGAAAPSVQARAQAAG